MPVSPRRLAAASLLAAALAPAAIAQPTAGPISVTTAPPRDGTLPRPSPTAMVGQTVGVTMVTVAYGRPAARGRTLFGTGGIVPDGEVWRAGADEATTVTFSTDVRVEGQMLAAGTYGLFAIPERGASAWTVAFNRTARQWGAFQYDAGQDALRVRVTAERGMAPLDRFTVGFDALSDTSATMTLAWGDVRVPVRLSADTPAAIRAAGDAAARAATDWRAPFRYAQYALTNRTMLDAGAAWAARAASLEANYATMRLRALLAAEVRRPRRRRHRRRGGPPPRTHAGLCAAGHGRVRHPRRRMARRHALTRAASTRQTCRVPRA